MSGARCKAAICCSQLGAVVGATEDLVESEQITDEAVILELAEVADRAKDRMVKIVLEYADVDLSP